MGRRQILLLLSMLSLLIFIGPAFAGSVSETTAWQVAQNVMTNHVALHGDWSGSRAPHPGSIKVVSYNREPVAYLVTASPSGSLLVAYYDDFSPVLLYSPSATLDASKVGDLNAIESWIIPEIYHNIQIVTGKIPVIRKETNENIYLDSSQRSSASGWTRIAVAWAMLDVPSESFTPLNPSEESQQLDAATTTYASSIGPLLQTTWNQGDANDLLSPYNEYTPAGTDSGGCMHTLTGCWATAMAQVMKYWNWPVLGTGSNSYSWNGTTLSASFAHSYDWPDMPNTLSSSTTPEQNDAIARLMSDIGISINMDYGCSASDANYSSVIPSLTEYFNYALSAQLLNRTNYSATDWMNLMENELNATIPRVMLFSIGSMQEVRHAVVIDGYQTVNGTDQVHLNYGWGGFSDGYYDITNNWATSGYTWTANNQWLVLGIEPELNGASVQALTSQQVFPQYGPIASPVNSTNPCQAKPIGIGSIASGGDTVNVQISLEQFSGPVDIYFGIYAPAIGFGSIYVLKSNNTFQPFSSGLTPWKNNVSTGIDESLFGNIAVSLLPEGTYTLYLLVTSSGSLSSYYLWMTSYIKG